MKRLLTIVLVFCVTIRASARLHPGNSKKIEREPWSGGLIISDGDIPHRSMNHYRSFYGMTNPNELSLSNLSRYSRRGVQKIRDVWKAPLKYNLTYCISNEFADVKQSLIDAFEVATEDWMEAADVEFRYVPEEDDNCVPENPNVVFDVNIAYGVGYAARAFFPSSPRKDRNILVSSNFLDSPQGVLDGIIRHELGHALGFLHEHIRAENGFRGCEEPGDYEALTAYDSRSVMHYPQCGGTNSFDNLVLTDLDVEGAALAYPKEIQVASQ